MRTSVLFGSCALAALGTGLALGSFNAGCAGLSTTATATGGSTGAGGGGSALLPGEVCVDASSESLAIVINSPLGTLTLGSAGTCSAPTDCPSGQTCTGGNCQLLPRIVLPQCAGGTCAVRTIKLTVNPDSCAPSDVEFTSADTSVVQAPANATVSLHNDVLPVTITAGPTAGLTTVTATVYAAPQIPVACQADADCQTKAPATPSCHKNTCVLTASAAFAVEVDPAAAPSCAGLTTAVSVPALAGGDPALTLGAASISLPPGAANPDKGSFLWGVAPFPATIACKGDLGLTGYTALGPAITFGPADSVFQREIPLTIPVDPGLMPATAYLRHVQMVYSGPGFKAPRIVPVADMHFTQVTVAGQPQWALGFMAPRLGTYQAVVAPTAGTNTFTRTMTHRAVVGISMGGGGTASFGLRHHDLIDTLAPLGGPVDWTWMLDYIADNHLGGFRPIAKGTTLNQIQLTSATCMTSADCKSDETCIGVLATAPGKCRVMPKVSDPYAHPQTFNTWWYEYPNAGNGGTFDRGSYVQIFRDLALMYGNPNGENLSPGGQNLPAGVPPTDPSVVGNHPGNECAVWVDPLPCPADLDGSVPDTCPQLTYQQELANDCPIERCKNTLTLQNYFDGTYNPDGIFPVITVCDGNSQSSALTPYANTWHSDGNNYPLEVGLAVDYNGNGVRDELEPIIRAGHEPWLDYGADGIPSSMEPGYAPGVNDDPNGDDYNAQYNPSGTENNHRYEVGEHFDDFGLDGVPNTPQQPAAGYQKPGDGYDVGEGDGKFTVSTGLQRFWDRDAHSIVRQMVDPTKVPGGPLTDTALQRLDMWTDGGLRDLFNFGVDAQHLVGAFAARGRAAGYLTGFSKAPGLDPTQPPDAYNGKLVDWDALPGVVLQRYGEIDPTANDISDGSGQHVGSASEIIARLEAALYFIGSRWRDRTELFLRVDTSVPPIPNCSEGSSTIIYPAVGSPLGPSQRRGPVGISLPPGYCSSKLQGIRYPVIFLLHGYGQSPQDLEPTIVLLQNFMNDADVSTSQRLVKAIIVYVDGRCRTDADGTTAECLQGTFFADSPRPTSALDETWWLELMTYLDQNYRTLQTTDVSWTE
jgi:hypothetical protein